MGGRNQEYFVIIRYLHNPRSGTVLSESELGLVVYCNVYSKFEGNHSKSFKKTVIDMLRKERKWNHTKHSIKTTNCRKRVEDENSNKEQG